MDQLQRNQSILYKYIPEKAVPVISEWIYRFDFKLRIKKSRSSKYGDYRPPANGRNHLITINYDMNKYAFLITLVHEIAHLSSWDKHEDRVPPHGKEWKEEFKFLMTPFMNPEHFPEDILKALSRYMKNPAASSCSDTNLLRTLKKYDVRTDTVLLEEIGQGSIFTYGANRQFVKGEKIRKRFKCREIKTSGIYLFDPLTEVSMVSAPLFAEKAISG